MPSLEELVQCLPARDAHLAEVQCLVPSAGWFPRERKKEVKKEQVGVRDKRMNCQRRKNELSETSWTGLVSPKALLQELLLARMCHASV